MDKPVGTIGRRIDLNGYPSFRVGNASIDPASREARFRSTVERIQPQTLKALIALWESAGSVVTRECLIERCWEGRFVGDDVINRSILLIRKLADHAGGFHVETIPKAGYRLIEDSSVTAKPAAEKSLAWIVPIAALALTAMGIAYVQPTHPADPKPPTVALLPFTATPDPGSRNLATAAGDTVSHMLLSGRFPARLKWPASGGDLASADLLLSGHIDKVAGGFSAVVQLRDRPTGTIIFTRSYQVTDAQSGDLPEQIGAEFASNLTGSLAVMVLDRRHPISPQFTAEKLKGISSTVSGGDPLIGYSISRKQIAEAPNVPLTQLGLAFDTAFALGEIPMADRPDAVRHARAAADKAQRMVPDFGDAYVPWCLLRPVAYARPCEDRIRAGLKADPDAPFAPAFLSNHLISVGRFEESLQFARIALAADPYHPHKLRRVIKLTALIGSAEKSEQLFQQARAWWPNHQAIYWDRLSSYVLRGDLGGAQRFITESPTAALPIDRTASSALFRATAINNLPALRALCTDPAARYATLLLCISALRPFGDRDTAIRVAAKFSQRLFTGNAAEDERIWLNDPELGMDPILSAPAMKWVRSDPRYLTLVQRTGLLNYWRKDRLPDFCRPPGEPVCASL